LPNSPKTSISLKKGTKGNCEWTEKKNKKAGNWKPFEGGYWPKGNKNRHTNAIVGLFPFSPILMASNILGNLHLWPTEELAPTI
jgi:hypothetical protein